MRKKQRSSSRIAYFDCFAGVSGDMIVGALIDAGGDVRKLKAHLAKLPLGKFRIDAQRRKTNFISGMKFSVTAPVSRKGRHLKTIYSMLKGSDLPAEVVKTCIAIFRRLAEAEARIHGTSIEDVHFHEVGATDSIIDIVSAVYLIHDLQIDKVYSSALRLGSGHTNCSHGTLPIPAPATLELLKGIPVVSAGYEAELVTPTGAAIISTLSSGYGGIPEMRVESIGYGLGDREIGNLPNCVRVLIGSEEKDLCHDEVDVLTTNLDDVSPQVYDLLIERLYNRGALEVYLQSVQMKKNRPGVLVTVLVPPSMTEDVAYTLIRETGTLGVRIVRATRRKLERETVRFDTDLGAIRVKIAHLPDGSTVLRPEYDDVKRIARREGLPFREVHACLMKQAKIVKPQRHKGRKEKSRKKK